MVRRLPRVVPYVGDEPEVIPEDHPMRTLTQEIAADPTGWTDQKADVVTQLFDHLASEWHTRDRPERFLAITDALDRGGPFADGVALELGSGTGITTATLAARFPRLVAADLSMEMLRLAPAIVPRLRADGARLPFADGAIATLLLVNMLLFPDEAARILSPEGAIVWVNTTGHHTPIYLSAEDVDAALPGDWDVVASEAGRGTWCVARRSGT